MKKPPTYINAVEAEKCNKNDCDNVDSDNNTNIIALLKL